MLGERYFATRERLSNLLRGIAELATETATAADARPPLADIQASLNAPFLLVVCGEVNAGKSALLNGLCDYNLCPVNSLPETSRVTSYHFGDPPRDVDLSPLQTQCYRPLDLLRDFTLVDTPGTNSAIPGHQELTARFLAAADLILFVFPISNPWGAATWDAVSRLPAACLERLVFIIQQADQRDSNDIKVIVGHIADLATKRLGQVPPIFAVSAKLAAAAKCAKPADEDVLLASGFPALEDFISNNICQSPARRKLLESCRDQAAAALHNVDVRIEAQSFNINSHKRFIEQLEREINEILDQFVSRLPRHLAGVATVFESDCLVATKLLHRRLGALASILRLFTCDSIGPAMETFFIERLQTAVVAVAQQDGVAVANACLAHWQDLGQRVHSAMNLDLQPSEPINLTLETARNRFVQRLGLAARQGVGNLKVRNQLDKDLRRRNRALKSFVFMTLVFTIAGATCGVLDVPWLPAILCGLAALFLTGGVLAAWTTRQTITREFQQRLLNTCGTFASTLHSDYEEALHTIFRDYAAALDTIRTHLAHDKLAIEPRLKRWQELFLTLKTIEQDL